MRVHLFALAPALALAGTLTACGVDDSSHPPAIDSAPKPTAVGSTTGGGTTVVVGTGNTTTGNAVVLVDGIPTPQAIAVSDTNVFFTSGTSIVEGGTGATISSVAKTGGVVTPVVTGLVFPTDLLDVNGVLVWIDRGLSAGAGAVFELDPATGVVTQLATLLETPTAIASDGIFVYIASTFPSGGVSIDRVPIGGGPIFSVTTVVGDFTSAGMVIDSQNAYFVGASLAGGVVYRVPLTGGPAEALFSTSGGTLGDVAVADGRVFWTLDTPALGGATILSIPIGGGAVTTVTTGQPHAVHLTADAANLFWTTGTDGEVISVPLGGGTPVVVASGLSSALQVASADAVYVTTATGIVRISN